METITTQPDMTNIPPSSDTTKFGSLPEHKYFVTNNFMNVLYMYTFMFFFYEIKIRIFLRLLDIFLPRVLHK